MARLMISRSVIGGGMITTGEVLSQTWMAVPGEFDAVEPGSVGIELPDVRRHCSSS